MSNKRIRGIAIHRPILIGSTSTPLTPAEKLTAPPDHTHKWTVAVRSAASHPLPSLSTISGLNASSGLKQGDEVSTMNAAAAAAAAAAGTVLGSSQASPGAGTTPAPASLTAGIATRGKELEVDYHRLVGGKDDISHFVRRVQFKLHDTYTQPTRNIDKPPFSVTETGWGEFEIQVKIFFVPDANEKPVTVFHHLKLHPWLNMLAPSTQSDGVAGSAGQAVQSGSGAAATAANAGTTSAPDTGNGQVDAAASADVGMVDANGPSNAGEGAPSSSGHGSQPAATAIAASAPSATNVPTAAPPALPPVVHSWQYDEIVFPEPTEAFYEVLIANPPTPLPVTSAQAFSDPSAYRSYQSALDDSASKVAVSSKQPLLPPHPLHAPTGYLFDALSQEAQQAESDRLDMARISAVKELERGRERLIKAERALKEARNRLNSLPSTSSAEGAAVPSATSS
ncbi:uncharacterized protein PFL1_02364 [Pseudozyma flocculosa PF-1]|uniref:Protein AF-9 homolog n=1 Tax=Pseudozyma flocculosa TaxID=84751 RepID=A0A5C3F6X5_9BASI|nr:uncharacterized protein PFL1_02364 [Pseudozyma flocculosa PF-1]EPQ30248.1 hypothetical protein PFL1_02364 [Pseudozyma flocculosa PF-1]SPO39816.1 related to YAF9 - Component of a chromatin modifying complex [Pseudozyma flocculosa]